MALKRRSVAGRKVSSRLAEVKRERGCAQSRHVILIRLANLMCTEGAEIRVLYELLHVLKGENFASGRDQQLAHVFAAHSEAPPRDAGYHFECRLIRRSVYGAK